MLVIHCPLLLLFIFVPFQWLFHFTVCAFPKQMPHYLHSEKLSTSTEENKRRKITFKSPTATQRLKTSVALHHRKRGFFLLFSNVNVHYAIYYLVSEQLIHLLILQLLSLKTTKMYVYINIYIYVCICVYVYVCICLYIYCMYMYMCVDVCMCIYIYIYIYIIYTVYIYMYMYTVCICVCMYAYMFLLYLFIPID